MMPRPEHAVTPDSHAQPPAADLPQPSAGLRSFLVSPTGSTFLRSIAGYFHATLKGHEHIPRQGPALIVSNHALFALDSAVLGALLVEHVQRFPRFLADRALWKIPGLRGVIRAIGGLPGDPRSAEVLLRSGELVVVYPGGVDDSLKHNWQHHRLMWKKRAGFARVAMTARVPIIPIVGLGIDDMYRVIGREHFVGRRIFGSERYDLPVPVGALGTILPRRAPQHYEVLPPIDTSGDPTSDLDTERVRAATYNALETRLREFRRQRGEQD
jgi:1-acyl-sn-glycerol-3-phosphate acyltransferase